MCRDNGGGRKGLRTLLGKFQNPPKPHLPSNITTWYLILKACINQTLRRMKSKEKVNRDLRWFYIPLFLEKKIDWFPKYSWQKRCIGFWKGLSPGKTDFESDTTTNVDKSVNKADVSIIQHNFFFTWPDQKAFLELSSWMNMCDWVIA